MFPLPFGHVFTSDEIDFQNSWRLNCDINKMLSETIPFEQSTSKIV